LLARGTIRSRTCPDSEHFGAVLRHYQAQGLGIQRSGAALYEKKEARSITLDNPLCREPQETITN